MSNVIQTILFKPAMMKNILLLLLLTFSTGAFCANITWAIVINPAGGGSVVWQTTQPVNSGTLSKSGSLTIAEGAYVDLTFQVNDGFKLERVIKNLDDWTPWLDSNHHYQFGPVSKRHVIVATFSQINPEASLTFESPAVLPEGVAPVYDATGHYSGVIPVGSHRHFDAYAAMDETGKIDVLPNLSSLDGYTSDPSNKPVAATLKTVNDKPEVKVSGKLVGTRDGVAGDVAGSRTLSEIQAIPLENTLNPSFQALPAESAAPEQVLNAEGIASYNVKLKNNQTGIKLSLRDKALAVNLPVTTDATREWSVNVDLQERLDAKNKTRVYAKALLSLPNGEQVSFPERIVKYSRKSGYTLSFVRGTNLTSQKVDKKTKLTIKKMLFSCNTSPCTLSDGEMQYSFLGQKGKAELLDFMVR
jgi:hypothetical protein